MARVPGLAGDTAGTQSAGTQSREVLSFVLQTASGWLMELVSFAAIGGLRLTSLDGEITSTFS